MAGREIILKEEMNLSIDNLSFLINNLKLNQDKALTINLYNVRFIDACYIPIFKALTEFVNVQFIKSSQDRVNKYILEQDGQRLARDTAYPMKISDNKSFISSQTQDLIEYLRYYLDDEETSKYIAFILQELVSNIFDHSYSSIGAIINGQVYPNRELNKKRGYVQLAVLDTGVGFKETLSQKYQVSNEIEAIKKATEKNITSAINNGIYGNKNNVGFGLYAIKEFIKYLRGRMIIVSNNGIVQFNSSKKIRPVLNTQEKFLKFGWNGSIVIIEVPMKTLDYYEFDVLMELIRQDENLDVIDINDIFEDF